MIINHVAYNLKLLQVKWSLEPYTIYSFWYTERKMEEPLSYINDNLLLS